jgi:hypothetical protein
MDNDFTPVEGHRYTQKISLIRCVTRTWGAKTVTFWSVDGADTFVGRASHMKALKQARLNAAVVDKRLRKP